MSKPEPSVEETAAGIVKTYYPDDDELESAIVAALKARDERAVRIIEEHRQMDVCNDNCWTTIKAAIREGKE